MNYNLTPGNNTVAEYQPVRLVRLQGGTIIDDIRPKIPDICRTADESSY